MPDIHGMGGTAQASRRLTALWHESQPHSPHARGTWAEWAMRKTLKKLPGPATWSLRRTNPQSVHGRNSSPAPVRLMGASEIQRSAKPQLDTRRPHHCQTTSSVRQGWALASCIHYVHKYIHLGTNMFTSLRSILHCMHYFQSFLCVVMSVSFPQVERMMLSNEYIVVIQLHVAQ